jgi:hypothetical protein
MPPLSAARGPGLTRHAASRSALRFLPALPAWSSAWSLTPLSRPPRSERVLAARLPLPMVVSLWDTAVVVVAEGLLTGLAGVRKCTLEGRANMSFDLSHVERQASGLGARGFLGWGAGARGGGTGGRGVWRGDASGGVLRCSKRASEARTCAGAFAPRKLKHY